MPFLTQLGNDVRAIRRIRLANQIDPVGRLLVIRSLDRLLKQENGAADLKLIAVVQILRPDEFPVDQRTVRTVPIAQDERAVAEMDRSVLPGDFGVADPDVVPAAAPQ